MPTIFVATAGTKTECTKPNRTTTRLTRKLDRIEISVSYTSENIEISGLEIWI